MFTSYGSYGYPYSPAAVSSAQADASSAKASAREAMTETELLRHDVDRLLMLTEALWGFLKKEHGYTDEQLADAVKEIDLRDGRLDGKAAKVPPTACPQCHRLNSAKFSKCIYCGSPLPVALFGG
jgi:hypothetical protein